MPVKKKNNNIDTWQEMTVQAVSNAFNKHFWKIIAFIIVVIIGVSGFTIKTKKGTTIEKKPLLKMENAK